MTSNERLPLPVLLRNAERRVNQHIWGDKRAIVSIPAVPDRDVDILLLEAADEIERLSAELKDHMWWERTALELERQRNALSAALEAIRERGDTDDSAKAMYWIATKALEASPADETTGEPK
jgi:hypothetical protein